jgi:hypothetical protein
VAIFVCSLFAAFALFAASVVCLCFVMLSQAVRTAACFEAFSQTPRLKTQALLSLSNTAPPPERPTSVSVQA